MRFAAATLCLGLLCTSAHADERWTDAACKSVQDLTAFYSKDAPDLTTKAWSIRPLLVLQRDHCGVEVTMKIDETDKVIRRHLWPAHVCTALNGTKGVRQILAKQLDAHCAAGELR